MTNTGNFSSEDIARSFATWTNSRLRVRQNFLDKIANGDSDTVAEIMRSPLLDISFPGGFNPTDNPQHNEEAVVFELDRRGASSE